MSDSSVTGVADSHRIVESMDVVEATQTSAKEKKKAQREQERPFVRDSIVTRASTYVLCRFAPCLGVANGSRPSKPGKSISMATVEEHMSVSNATRYGTHTATWSTEQHAEQDCSHQILTLL